PRRLRHRLHAGHALVEHCVIGPPLIRRRGPARTPTAGLISRTDWERPGVRWTVGTMHTLLLVFLFVIGLGPLLWLAKSAITPTFDTLSHPISLFPHGSAWSNLTEAWTTVHVGLYFWNTIL